MNRKEKRARKNANHRRNERRRYTIKAMKTAAFLQCMTDAASAMKSLQFQAWDGKK